MILKQLTAKNFLSFKELSYNFANHPVLIQGDNLTEDSQESNGSGKSAIQAAIEYCLFKTTSRKEVIDTDLINWDEESCELSLSIDCPIRKEILLIERKIKTKGSGESQLSINGTVKFAFKDKMVNEINKAIIEWIGISKEDLQNYFILNKERYKSFFSSSNKEKIEMINRFSNAKLINGVDKYVQEDVDKIQSQINQLDYKKNSLVTKIKVYNQQIKDEYDKDFSAEYWSDLHDLFAAITKLEESLVKFKEDKGVQEELITSKLNRIKQNEARLNELTPAYEEVKRKVELFKTKFEELSKEANLINQQMITLDTESSLIYSKRQKLLKDKRDLEEIVADIDKILAGTIECPKCKHKFVLDPDVNLEEEKEQKEKTEQLLGMISISLDSVSDEIEKSKVKENTLTGHKTQIRMKELDLTEKKKEIQKSVDKLKEEIEDLSRKNAMIVKAEIPTHQLTIENLDKKIEFTNSEIKRIENQRKGLKMGEVDMVRVNDWRQLMKNIGKELYDLNKEIKELKIKEFEVSQWIFNFKKFNMFLANQSLKIIQGYCNKFLQDIKSDIQIRWEGVKLLANGDLREEITPYIIRNNKMKSFWSFSGGERARMDYSMIFTLQDMINKTNKWGGLQFLSTDEIAEGMDGLGLNDLMNSLNNLNRTVLITTHVVNRKISNNILLVRKENGVSTIVN